MTGIPQEAIVDQVASGLPEEEFIIELNPGESFSLSELMDNKLKEDLRKAREDLNAANAQIEVFKKNLEELKEQKDKECKGRRAGWKKCFRLKMMTADLIDIILDLATFSKTEASRRSVDVGDGSCLNNVELKMLEDMGVRLGILHEMLYVAESARDFENFDKESHELEAFKLLTSKLRSAAGVYAPSSGEGNEKAVEEEENGNDNELMELGAVPTPPPTQHHFGEATRSEEDAMKSRDQRTSKVMHGICRGRDNSRRCICGYTARKLGMHIWRVTTGRPFTSGSHVCSICEDRYKTRQGLNRHLARHRPNNDNGPVLAVIQKETRVCANDVMTVSTPQSTSALVNDSPRPIPREIPQSTNSIQSTAVASASNAYKNLKFKCPSCSKCFLFQSQLRYHCWRAHWMIVPGLKVRCWQCRESFRSYIEFLGHQHKKHFQSSPKFSYYSSTTSTYQLPKSLPMSM